MEFITTITTVTSVLIALKEAVDAATDLVESVDRFIITVRKTVGDFKAAVSDVVMMIDTDGDGTYDTERLIYRIDQVFPDFETGYTICNSGSQIGLGLPQFDIIDGREFPYLLTDQAAPSDPLVSYPTFELPALTGNGTYFTYDVDNDGANEIITPGADFTGDGITDWLKIRDENNDGLADASPGFPFISIDSKDFSVLIEQAGKGSSDIYMTPDGVVYAYGSATVTSEVIQAAQNDWAKSSGVLDKDFNFYTVSEGLLLGLAAVAGLVALGHIFRRRKY